MNTNENARDSERLTPSQLRLLIGVGAAVCVIFALNTATTPVERRSSKPNPLNREFALGAEHAYRGAGEKNRNDLALCEAELSSAIRRHRPAIEQSEKTTAKDISTYRSCLALIAKMVSDKVKQENAAETYVQEQFHMGMSPALTAFVTELNTILDRYDFALKANTVELAYTLAELQPEHENSDTLLQMRTDHIADVDGALRNLGISASVNAVVIPLDIWALSQSTIGKVITRKTPGLIARLFARPAATATAEVTIAAADGPLPIGDIIAILGGIWTAWDIHSSRKEFERELTTALENAMPQMLSEMESQIHEHIREMLKVHETAQNMIFENAIKGT